MKNLDRHTHSFFGYLKVHLFALLAFFTFTGCSVLSEYGPASTPYSSPTASPTASPVPVPTSSPDPGALVLSQSMGVGWNLGNTLEACGSWITGTTVASYETAWGNPVTTQAMIHAIAAAGFKSVRIPVAWSNLMASDYTINPDLLARVKVVADWVQAEGMTAMINLHWDSGWIAGFSTSWDTCMAKYTSIWTQVSGYFKDEGLGLVFESLNEEGSWSDVWDGYGTTGKQAAYTMLNRINQKFVDIVRSGSGNNPQRYLLIAGYGTDIDKTCDPLFLLPSDPAGRFMVSIHYYTPATFAILSADASWGTNAQTWGTAAEIQTLKNYMASLKSRFVDKGIPVVMGEFGCPTTNKEAASVVRFLSSVAAEARAAGVCPMLWDAGGHFNRGTLLFNMPDVLSGLQASM